MDTCLVFTLEVGVEDTSDLFINFIGLGS